MINSKHSISLSSMCSTFTASAVALFQICKSIINGCRVSNQYMLCDVWELLC